MIKLTVKRPKVELFEQTSDEQFHIARCARVCYGREKGNNEATYNRLLRDKHWSMFRHWSVYAIISRAKLSNCLDVLINRIKYCPYIHYVLDAGSLYISTNKNFMLDIKDKDQLIYTVITDNEIDYESAYNNEVMFNKLIRYTFIIDTSIAVSRELNRVSPNNIAERSTRYVLEDGSICRPFWLNECAIVQQENGQFHVYADNGERWDVAEEYLTQTRIDFDVYKYMISRGMPREAARGKLPLDTATRCVYTYTIQEWRRIIDLRYYGTTGKPHPDAKIIADKIRKELINQGHEFIE